MMAGKNQEPNTEPTKAAPAARRSRTTGTSADKRVAFWSGGAFILLLLVVIIAILYFPPQQTGPGFALFLFASRLGLSLAAAGIASRIPGFIEVLFNLSFHETMRATIQGGGAIAVFLVVYLVNPPELVKNMRDAASYEQQTSRYLQENRPRHALQEIAEWAKIQPESIILHKFKGDAYYRLGVLDRQQSDAHFAAAVDWYTTALQLASEQGEENEEARLHGNLGAALLRLELYDEARKHTIAFLQKQHSIPDFGARFNLALIDALEGNYESAARRFKEVYDRDSSLRKRAALLHGLCLLFLGRVNEARESLCDAIRRQEGLRHVLLGTLTDLDGVSYKETAVLIQRLGSNEAYAEFQEGLRHRRICV
jgi:tetratricopeptide (TPR) repeat protein